VQISTCAVNNAVIFKHVSVQHANDWPADWLQAHVQTLKEQIPGIADAGFTAVWLPPPSDAVSAQGYLPRDYYNINSKYGTEAELRELLAVMHENGVKAIADIVINHRCAHFQVAATACGHGSLHACSSLCQVLMLQHT